MRDIVVRSLALIGLFWIIAVVLVRADGERLNGIYLGEDVTGSGGGATAVWIQDDGTVTVYIGALVPGIKDKLGRDVRVKRVKAVRE